MEQADINELINAAQKQVNAIFSQLEIDTGMLVKNVSINDTDVTNISDTREQILRHVYINMVRLPDTRWAKY